MRHILFVHQSADLYGSDKVLLDIAIGIRPHGFMPIVLLPSSGLLHERLKAAGIETHNINVAKLTRATYSLAGLARLPLEVIRSVRQIDTAVAGRKIYAVHSNTLAVLGGAFWAKLRRVPHLWHVHELLLNPKVASSGFPWLVNWLADKVICNSNMTAKWLLDKQPALKNRAEVVWNGVERNTTVGQLSRLNHDKVVVALVGRINRLKGQPILVDAATRLWLQGHSEITYSIVGGPPAGQENYLVNLRHLIDQSPAHHVIAIRDFTENIWSAWDSCDIAVVPSTEPESFGLVAVEAMAAGKPVIAAAHGGLLDIVVDGETGILVPPGDAEALATAISKLASNPEMRTRYGEAGKARQKKLFSLEHQIAETVRCYESMAQVS